MEKPYIHNSLMFIGSTSHNQESFATRYFNPALTKPAYYPSGYQGKAYQDIYLETLSLFYSNDEYIGSTSPYDDDGC